MGLDGLVGYNAKQQTRQDSTAVVSQLNAGAVQLNVRGALQDEGTRYRAGDGALNIKAASHNAIAASDSHQSSEQGVEARLGLRVYTTTGEDEALKVIIEDMSEDIYLGVLNKIRRLDRKAAAGN